MDNVKWKYNKALHQIDEQPTGSSEEWLAKDLDGKYYKTFQDFGDYLATLRHTPVSGKVDWKDGEDVTGKFKEQYQEKGFTLPPNNWKDCTEHQYERINESFRRIVAIPIKQEQPQRSEEAKIAHAISKKSLETVLKNQSQEQPVERGAISLLLELSQLKMYKDHYGKDEYYIKRQPELWKDVNYFLDSYKKQFTIKRK